MIENLEGVDVVRCISEPMRSVVSDLLCTWCALGFPVLTVNNRRTLSDALSSVFAF